MVECSILCSVTRWLSPCYRAPRAAVRGSRAVFGSALTVLRSAERGGIRVLENHQNKSQIVRPQLGGFSFA